jgi:hypothetical protein
MCLLCITGYDAHPGRALWQPVKKLRREGVQKPRSDSLKSAEPLL